MIPRKNLVSISIIIVMVLSSFTSMIPNTAVASPPKTLYVGGSGPGNYTTIQDAIDDANEGDTVFVHNGTYYENVIVNKTINLVGQDRSTTIINANGKKDAVYISANSVNISCFTLTNGGTTFEDAGIDIHSNYNTIKNNHISLNRDRGIGLWSSNGNIITGNLFTKNSAINIYLYHSSNNSITNNTVAGINSVYCVYLDFSNDNKIYHNNFINNTPHQATDHGGTNSWDNGYPSGGNYWSDFDGWDALHGPSQDIGGGDGISDTPYNITGDSNQDRYPLMHPYSPYSNVYLQGLEPLYTTEHIEIAVTITPKETIAGAQFDMSFNPDMLSIEWVAEGDVFSEYDTYFDQGVIDNTNGTLKNVVSIIITPNGSTTNQGSIAVMSIRAKTITGETSLNLSNVIVGGPDGTSVDVTIINTTVTIYPHDRWDVNWDDHINILDLILIGQHWGEIGTPCWIPADVNCDGVVNILDMILVGQHWTG